VNRLFRFFKDRLLKELGHAFATASQEGRVSEEERQLLEKLASYIESRGMVTPAIVFLESVGPLSFVGSQLLYCLDPVFESLFPSVELDRLARLLEKRESLALLKELLERK